MKTLRWVFAALVLALLAACGAEPAPRAKSASEYLAMIDRDPRVAAVRIFVGLPIVRNDQWADDDVPQVIRKAVADSLAAMGFTMVGMENDADAIARIRYAYDAAKQVPIYELEFMRGSYEVDSFLLEDTTTLSCEGLSKAERVKRVYTRMVAARAATITKSPRILALAERRASDQAAAAKSAAPPTPPKIDPPAVAGPAAAAERDKAITWMQATNKAASAAAVSTFTQQLDGIIGSGQDGQWQLGWGLTKDGMARVARWRAGSFETRSITPVEAASSKIAETSSTFSTYVRGSLAPLGPSSAPPPPQAPPSPPPLPPNTETGTGRAAAVAWLNAHAKGGQIAASLIEQLDDVIKTGTRGEWKIGWSLTQNGKAYFFAYTSDGAFQATELSVADAQSKGYQPSSVTFSKLER